MTLSTIWRAAGALLLLAGVVSAAQPLLDQWPGSAELLARRPDHDRAQLQARAWLDALPLDVLELDAVGIAGKKKLAELLTAYSVLHRHADAADRPRILARVRELAAQTASPAYHQLAAASDADFDANSMSYLRVLWLLDGFGLDLRGYHEHVLAIKPRLDESLAGRGPWQRAMFHRYYSGLGLEMPAALADADLSTGVIANRMPLQHYLQIRRGADGGIEGGPTACYALTHEILVAFHYGEDLDQTVFDADDLAYLLGVLPPLLTHHVDHAFQDLAAEFMLCMAFLGWRDHPAFEYGIHALLDTQNEDGSWGDYEALRPRWGEHVDQRVTLHTTLVASWALLEAFQADRPVREPETAPAAAVSACVDLANQLWDQGQPARAEAALVQALTMVWPDRVTANAAAKLLWDHGQLDSGRARLESRLARVHLGPDGRARIHSALAHLDYLQGQYARGQAHLTQARQAAPAAPALTMLQVLYLRQQRDLDGIITMLHPMPAPLSANAEAWLSLGEALFWSQRLDDAVAAFERCLRIDDTVHLAHNNLAWIFAVERGRPDEALPHAERALALAPGVADYHDTYLEVLMRLGRRDEAREHLTRILGQFPDHAGLQQRARDLGL